MPGSKLLDWLMACALVLAPVGARADKPQWALHGMPFAQVINLDALYDVAHSPPAALLDTLRRHGVDVRRVPSAEPARPLNPLLAGLPPADAALIAQAEVLPTHEGRLVCGGDPCCGLGRDTILIRDTARSWTLIHEFVHALLRAECPAEPDAAVQARFDTAYRRLQVCERRLYDDPYKLLEPQWRRDILAVQTEVAADLFGRIRGGHAQEAIAEKLLSRIIDEQSPYFDAERRAEGLRYGEAMIDAAIDLFNAIHAATTFVQQTVARLRDGLRDGSIPPGERTSLTDADLAAAIQAGRAIDAQLAQVRDELQALKAFYTR